MFNIRCIDCTLEPKLAHPERHYPPHACEELAQFLGALRQYGEIARTDFFLGHINRVSGTHVCLYYLSKLDTQEVIVLDIAEKYPDTFTFQDSANSDTDTDDWDDRDVIDCIPQYDKPAKIIKAVDLIRQGIQNSHDLGWELGHRAEKPKDIARQGQYALKTLEALKLITLEKHGRQSTPVLTERGMGIADAPDHDTQEALLIAAMLNYAPVMTVIGAVTEDNRKLDDDLVKELIFPVEFRDADTSNRRAQTIKSWVKWICHYQLLPIAIGDGMTQLPLPMLFATTGGTHSGVTDDGTQV